MQEAPSYIDFGAVFHGDPLRQQAPRSPFTFEMGEDVEICCPREGAAAKARLVSTEEMRIEPLLGIPGKGLKQIILDQRTRALPPERLSPPQKRRALSIP